MNTNATKLAIPLEDERVSAHFGHAGSFLMVEIESGSGRELGREHLVPPPHEPGRLPAWLAENGVTVVLSGGMGPRAVSLLQEQGIDVRIGVPSLEPDEAVRQWLQGELVTAGNLCDHGEGRRHGCRHS